MKYIKTFEDLNIEPKVGDYVIMKKRLPYVFDNTLQSADLRNFTSNNIGEIVGENLTTDYNYIATDDEICINVEYENIPNDLLIHFTSNYPDHLEQNLLIFRKKDVKMFDSSKEDLEARLSANKYNL